ncbi:hypothetical protein ACHAWF_011244 [Thalassiosira exigua]
MSSRPDQSSSSSSSSSAGEEILILYGSQTGNSEAAAQDVAHRAPLTLLSPSPCRARCMHLDDFLEFEEGRWTRLVVIVCSSYGVGQAPIGARKFRDFCDAISDRAKERKEGGGGEKFLAGVSFALLGLGDSHYSTFFRNPTAIHDALTSAGATRVGALGKADASGTGDAEQSKVVERWIDGTWDDLAKVLAEKHPGDEALEKAREETWRTCLELFPEWEPRKYGLPPALLKYRAVVAASVLVALISILTYQYWGQQGLP